MKIIDAHQHFWSLGAPWFAWPTPDLKAIYRDFQPDDLAPELRAAGVKGTVLVQAAPATGETAHMLDLASRHGIIFGVVGWIDFEDGSAALQQIDTFARDPKFKAVRPMLQGIEKADWILNASFTPILAALAERELAFDALIQPRHLPVVAKLAEQHPGLRIVIDHAAKPNIADRDLVDWAAGLRAFKNMANVCCKFSGLLTEAKATDGFVELQPVFDRILDAFGPGRILWGSDWPVINLVSSYQAWLDLSLRLTASLTASERQQIFYANAKAVYRLATEESRGD